MSKTNPKVDFFFKKAAKWREEFEKLRTIVLGCGLTEELKWGQPCYTSQKRNIVLIHGFKEYCALLFFKGAVLTDAKSILVQQTENVQAARQIRFTGDSGNCQAENRLDSVYSRSRRSGKRRLESKAKKDRGIHDSR